MWCEQACRVPAIPERHPASDRRLLFAFRFDEWGTPDAGDGAALTPENGARFLYTGQVWMRELGLYHYKARMYSPLLGRFMQTDPVGYADQMNLHAYVGNDPLNNVDPTGKFCSTYQWWSVSRDGNGRITSERPIGSPFTIGECGGGNGGSWQATPRRKSLVGSRQSKSNPCGSDRFASALGRADVQSAMKEAIRMGTDPRA